MTYLVLPLLHFNRCLPTHFCAIHRHPQHLPFREVCVRRTPQVRQAAAPLPPPPEPVAEVLAPLLLPASFSVYALPIHRTIKSWDLLFNLFLALPKLAIYLTRKKALAGGPLQTATFPSPVQSCLRQNFTGLYSLAVWTCLGVSGHCLVCSAQCPFGARIMNH